MEVRKKWQHWVARRFDGGVVPRRLATTSATYAAVPHNDAAGGRQTGTEHGKVVPAQVPHRQVPVPVSYTHLTLPTILRV